MTVKIIPKSSNSTIGEEHLYPILSSLEHTIEDYEDLIRGAHEEDYIYTRWYENKLITMKKVLKEINEAMENIES